MNLARVYNVLKHEFYKDTFIMMIAVTMSNLFTYLYQLVMGRLLSVEEYGVLLSLLSLIYILSVLFDTVNTSAVKFTTSYIARGKEDILKSLITAGTKFLFIFGVLIYVLLLILSTLFSEFLKVKSGLYFVFLFLSIPFSILLSFYQGALRGVQWFREVGLSICFWAFFRLIFGMFFVLLGFGVLGAIFGVVLSSLFALVLTALFLKRFLLPKSTALHKLDLRMFFGYSRFVFLALLSYSLMWNTDIILVKHYFSPTLAGQYSAISVLGRIILFSTMAVGMVVFPKAAERKERQKPHFYLLIEGLSLTFLISGVIIMLYLFFPKFVLRLFYGQKYLSIAPYLWRYGMAMMFLAMNNVIMNYGLSIDRFKLSYCLLSGALLEILMIVEWHQTIGRVINVMTLVNFIIFMELSIIVWKDGGRRYENNFHL